MTDYAVRKDGKPDGRSGDYERLTRIRKSRGVSQDDIARCAGVSKSAISMFEAGKFDALTTLQGKRDDVIKAYFDAPEMRMATLHGDARDELTKEWLVKQVASFYRENATRLLDPENGEDVHALLIGDAYKLGRLILMACGVEWEEDGDTEKEL